MSARRRELHVVIFPATDVAGQPVEGWFAAFLGNLQLCASAFPFRDAARALRALGAPSDMPIVGSFEGRPVSMRATVGSAERGFEATNVAVADTCFRKGARQ